MIPINIFYFIDVKVTQYGDVVEARTVQQSSIQCLVDSYEEIHSKGFEPLLFFSISCTSRLFLYFYLKTYRVA